MTKRLKPAEGLIVRFEPPAHGSFPAGGANVVMTRYYRRRVRDGDLVEAPAPKPAKGV